MPDPVYKFDDIVVDPARFQVCRGGRVLDLEPKSLRVLVFLIDNRRRAVSKEELLGAVWPGAFVTDNALTRVVAQLRKALGDNAKEARYIETVPTVGYRFLVEVEVAQSERPSSLAGSAPPGPVPKTWLRRFAPAILAILLAASGVLAWRRFSAPVVAARSNGRPPHLVQFTSSTGLDLNPAFSPDGSAIAYSSDRSGGFEIYIRPSATQGREVQVTSDGAQNVEPAWSPDGRHIAYRSAAKGGIWLVPALGGVARQLTTFGASPAWSRDGTTIAFQSAAPVSLAPVDIGGIATTIWMVSAQGGIPKQITTAASPPGKHVWPAWSPDGRWILFVNFGMDSATPNGARLWAVSPADGDMVSVTAGDRIYLNPIYAPDQLSIYYGSFTDSGNFGLWKLPIDPATDTATGAARDVQRTGMELPRDFAVSADGKRLAFTLSTMSSQLWTVPMSRSGFEPSGDPALLTPDTSVRKMHPAFSPDGKRIAFYSQLRGAPSEIWVMNADGSDATAISRRAGGSYMPSWLPDGKSVVYASHRSSSTYNVWLTSLDNGAEKPFLNLPRFMTAPHLSPDGREVVYHASKDGIANIWKGSVATGKQTQLTFDNESMNFPCWSPDGKWIAFEVRRGESTQLGVMPKDGGARTLLTEGRGHSWPYSWSPDGGKILFAGVRDGVWNVWWISRATGQQKRLTDYRSLRSYVRYPSWGPSGDQIVYERGETKGNIYLLDTP